MALGIPRLRHPTVTMMLARPGPSGGWGAEPPGCQSPLEGADFISILWKLASSLAQRTWNRSLPPSWRSDAWDRRRFAEKNCGFACIPGGERRGGMEDSCKPLKRVGALQACLAGVSFGVLAPLTCSSLSRPSSLKSPSASLCWWGLHLRREERQPPDGRALMITRGFILHRAEPRGGLGGRGGGHAASFDGTVGFRAHRIAAPCGSRIRACALGPGLPRLLLVFPLNVRPLELGWGSLLSANWGGGAGRMWF